MMPRLDTLAYGNGLRRIPPAHKLVFGMTLFIITFISHTPVQMLTFFVVSYWILVYAKISVRIYLAWLMLPFAFLLATIPAILIEVSRANAIPAGFEMLVSWQVGNWLIFVTGDSVQRMVQLIIRAFTSVACLYFLLFTVPISELIQLMRRWNIPAIVTDLMLIMYRYIFVVMDTASQLWVAQKSRGGHVGIVATLRDMGKLIAQLFVRTMHRYQRMYAGVASRGITEEFRVISTRIYIRSRRLEVESALCCLLLAALEWWVGGWGK